jgi:hypothetical protein
MRIEHPALAVALTCCMAPAHLVVAAPPTVVETIPGHADVGVDPALTELRIVFDQPMDPRGRSICGGGPSFPSITGAPTWLDARTMIVPVRLEPGVSYSFSVNCASARGFRSMQGEPAEISPVSFRTALEGDPAPILLPSEAADMASALRRVVDQHYSYRDRLGLDWTKLFDEAKDALESARTPAAFARTAASLLKPANDLHLWLKVNDIPLGTGRREISPNVDLKAIASLMPDLAPFPSGACGTLEGGVGYIAIHSWTGGDEMAKAALAALEKLKDSPGLIVDVRANSGGDELLARRFAAAFVPSPQVYSKNLIRDPNAEQGWRGPFDRVVEPATEGPRYAGRVAVLIGPACMSSCESFILMMRQPGRRELFGAKTWGSSGNPKPHELGRGVTMYVPSWKDFDAEGNEIEGVGVAPDHTVEWRPQAGNDPIIEAAMRWLKAEVAQAP